MQALAFTRQGLGDRSQDGVHVRRRTAPLHAGNSPLDPGFRRAVARAVAAFRPDVVWAHTPVPFPAEMACGAARAARVPFALTYHAGRLEGSSLPLRLAAAFDRATLQRRMLAGADRLMAVSPFVRDNALAAHRGRVTIVPPGVDARRFDAPHDAAGAGAEVLFVGPLSRTYRWKGLDPLWAAFRTVQARRPDACLTLVGDGDRVEELRARAHREGLHVRLAGRLGDEALVRAYRRAAVTVLPSTTPAEAFGMVLAEANACGRPVVGSRVGGIPDFVRHGDNGLLAAPGDADDLARQLLRVLEDPTLARAMGRRGRARVRREHDWDDLALACERVLEEAAGAPAAMGDAATPTGPSVPTPRARRASARAAAGLK